MSPAKPVAGQIVDPSRKRVGRSVFETNFQITPQQKYYVPIDAR
jgi:hypothetical protein